VITHLAALVLAGAVLGGCASAPDHTPEPAPAGNTATAPAATFDTARSLIVAVDNPPDAIPLRAGASLHAYETLDRYAEGAAARATLAAIARDYNLREITAWPIRALRLHCVVVAIPPGAAPDALLLRLGEDRRVRLVQRLQRFDTQADAADPPRYNDPYFDLQHGFAAIGAAAAQRLSRGDGVRVALIDTGVDANHPDLAGHVAEQRDFVGSATDAASAPTPPERHGTELAGVIAAVPNNHLGIVGIAPGVQLLAYRACWAARADADAAQCNSFTLARALGAAIDASAQVINLSLGGPADPLLARLAAQAMRQGAIIVGAVPADGRRDGFPLGVPGVIAVDALERGPSAGNGNAAPDEQRTEPLAAPGRDILSLVPGGSYDFASGSSLAAAHVSGALALLLGRQSTLAAADAQALLQSSRRPPGATAAGAIDICAALARLQATRDCLPAVVIGAP